MPWWGWIAGLSGVFVGWVLAHAVIADECERLGKFYIGSRTFRCVEVADRTEDKEKPGQ